jgi:hypothetical protein
MDNSSPFSRSKVQQRHDADHSPSSAEITNRELHLLSPEVPTLHVAGLHFALKTKPSGCQYLESDCLQLPTLSPPLVESISKFIFFLNTVNSKHYISYHCSSHF